MYNEGMKKTTMKEIADAAGVSVAAVSMILSGKGKISESVSTQVLNLAEEMGYKRKETGFTRAKRNFKYVAILQREEVSYLWNFSIPFALFLEDQVLLKGKNPIVFHVPAHYTAKQLFKEITGARVGAVFSLHYIDRDLFTDLEFAGIPVIILNNSEYQNEFSCVISDNLQGSYDATCHVIDLAHIRIGYADYHRSDYTSLVADRLFGYRRALEEKRLEFREDHRISVEISDYAGLQKKVRDIYSRDDAPTAWVVHDDFFAACLIEALKSIGKKVPRDISVIASGGDVLDYTLPFIPKIDTMQGDQKLMVSMAWSLLEARLESPLNISQVLKTKMTLFERGSCRFDMD